MPLELAHGPDLKVGVDGGSLSLTGDICLLGGSCIQLNNTSNRSSSADTAVEAGARYGWLTIAPETNVYLTKTMGDEGC